MNILQSLSFFGAMVIFGLAVFWITKIHAKGFCPHSRIGLHRFQKGKENVNVNGSMHVCVIIERCSCGKTLFPDWLVKPL